MNAARGIFGAVLAVGALAAIAAFLAQFWPSAQSPPPWDQAGYAPPPPPGPAMMNTCDTASYDCGLWTGPPVYTLYTFGRGPGYYRAQSDRHFHGGQGGHAVHRASFVAPHASFRPSGAIGHSRR